MSDEFLSRQNAFLVSMHRNRERLVSSEQRRLEEELHECVHQPLITKMAARLQKESVIETTEKFLQRKKERVDAMRRELEEKEIELIKSPSISDSSRFLAMKREEKLRSEGVLRPVSSPGQRLYTLAQHVTQKRQAAIEHAKPSVSGAVRPESALLELSCRLHLDAEKRKIKLEESRLAMLSAEENALKQASWAHTDCSSIRPQSSRDASNFTLVSPFCQGSEATAAAGRARAVHTDETEESVPLISDMSRFIAERMERRSGINSSQRLRMPLAKDLLPAQSPPNDNPLNIPRSSADRDGFPRDDSRFLKWREQQLSWHSAKLLKLQEFRKKSDEDAQCCRTKTALDAPEDLFFRKQLDKQMRHDHVMQSARAAKERQEAESLMSLRTTPRSNAARSAGASASWLKSTATHEARKAARFKGDT
jgi:hypothetical protein